MTYIFLVAGKGTRLHPLTLAFPKTLFCLDDGDTVIQRMVKLINKADDNAEIVVVTGFMHNKIEEIVKGVTFVFNPFFEVSNSVASLWFAREYLDRAQVTILNGDVVMSEQLVAEVLCRPMDGPVVLFDSSIKSSGDYNVHAKDGHVLVMSKNLESYDGEYAGVSKLDRASARKLAMEMDLMMESGQYDQWYEDALVQMIFRENFKLGCVDIACYQWTEVDTVDDLVLARKIDN